jgi:hypothetical protein
MPARASVLGLGSLAFVLAGCAGSGFERAVAFRLVGVGLKQERYLRASALRMTEVGEAALTVRSLMDAPDARTMAWLPMDFCNGTIEVDVASDLARDAPDYARGFVGVAFRIDERGRHESIYLRPANATVDDQVRRNHTVQYTAYPGYDFEELRKEAPERYETFANIALGRWIHMKIAVDGDQARLYLDRAANAALVVRGSVVCRRNSPFSLFGGNTRQAFWWAACSSA